MTKSVAVTVLSLATLILLVATSAQAAERMKSGQWENTFTAAGQSRTSSKCVTPQEVKAINGTPAEVRAEVEEKSAAGSCSVENFKMEGDVVSYTTNCAGTSTTETTSYHGDTFEMVMSTKGAPDNATAHAKGRRLGACQ
ncbi:MAG: DUF3617 family protein [Terriglobales bacterium]